MKSGNYNHAPRKTICIRHSFLPGAQSVISTGPRYSLTNPCSQIPLHPSSSDDYLTGEGRREALGSLAQFLGYFSTSPNPISRMAYLISIAAGWKREERRGEGGITEGARK